MRLSVFFALLILLGIGAYLAYEVLYAPNIYGEKRLASVKIPTNSNYEEVVKLLRDNHILKNEWSFEILSQIKKYPQQVKSGYYQFTRNMNNRQIINELRMGLQTPVTLVIYNIRTKEEFAGLIGRVLEVDSATVAAKLNNPAFCAQYGLDTSNILTHYIVDNYEFYWNAPLGKVMERLDTTSAHFWNADRLAKAEAVHLSPAQVTILASIVEKEVIHDAELPTVAGVYLNRLKINMALQADPTLVFALHDFDARRVTNYHKEFDSPYNTYMHPGLPPGPVCMPRKKSIDAVLNADQHEFLYFCANPDLSGYSIFSKSFTDQMKTASQYRKKMDEMHIH